eukprot:XP_027300914.1 uncharacterized protein LOC110353429 isoform X3 [Anas platyrhynchos]
MFAVSPPSKMHSEERLTLLVTGNKVELCGQSSVQLLSVILRGAGHLFCTDQDTRQRQSPSPWLHILGFLDKVKLEGAESNEAAFEPSLLQTGQPKCLQPWCSAALASTLWSCCRDRAEGQSCCCSPDVLCLPRWEHCSSWCGLADSLPLKSPCLSLPFKTVTKTK